MVRKLKYHEKKLLKKVDFISWEVDNNLHEVRVMKKYYIQKREDYTKYNKLSRHIRELARKIKEVDVKDPFRAEASSQVLEKLDGHLFISQTFVYIGYETRWSGNTAFLSFSGIALRHNMGLVPTKASLELCDKVNASSFCRRRLPVVMVRLHMAETLKAAVTFVEQGHVRVGPEVVTDPAFLVTRNLEDFVTWSHASAIKKHVMEYNDMRDDFDMMS